MSDYRPDEIRARFRRPDRIAVTRGVNKTGPSCPRNLEIWKIANTLKQTYGNPRHGNPRNPLDDLIYIILSTRTHDKSFSERFRAVKAAFPEWNSISQNSCRKLERLLIPGGLGRLKTQQIIDIIRALKSRFGAATLAPLSDMTTNEAENALTELPGVGPKIAKCVLMYALRRQVLPVDVHVHRIATRLGFQTKKRPDTSQELIESAVPSKLRYSFHVNAIAHGRVVCLSRDPRCHLCPLSGSCRYFRLHSGLGGRRKP